MPASALGRLGIALRVRSGGADRARLMAMLAKAEASHDGLLRGRDKQDGPSTGDNIVRLS